MTTLNMIPSLPLESTDAERMAHYEKLRVRLLLLLKGEYDPIATMATVVCELHHAFDYFHWTGFYRNISGELVIGPYQGSHGCLRIAFNRGVCGAAARTKTTQLVNDVHTFPGHIACSSSTQSELVIPWVNEAGELMGVFDADSDFPAAFTQADADAIAELLQYLRAVLS